MKPTRAPAELAAAFRERLGLGIAPIGDMNAIVAAGANVDVVIRDMPAGLDGMTRHDPTADATIIAVATTTSLERQRFSLAHELGHLLAGDLTEHLEALHATGAAETRAHEFARHLLAPLDGVRLLAQSRPDASAPELISAVVQRFGLSPIPASIQLHEIGAISTGEQESAGQFTAPGLAARFGWAAERRASQAESRVSQPPQRIVEAATRAYEQGDLSLRVLARVHGRPDVDALQQELREAGIVPRHREPRPIEIDDEW